MTLNPEEHRPRQAAPQSGHSGAARPWQRPRVILGTMDEAEINAGVVDDADPGGYPANAPS